MPKGTDIVWDLPPGDQAALLRVAGMITDNLEAKDLRDAVMALVFSHQQLADRVASLEEDLNYRREAYGFGFTHHTPR